MNTLKNTPDIGSPENPQALNQLKSLPSTAEGVTKATAEQIRKVCPEFQLCLETARDLNSTIRVLLSEEKVGEFNKLRRNNPRYIPNLQGVNLAGKNLTGVNFNQAFLVESDLSGANLARASLIQAMLANANLCGADLSEAELDGVVITGANLNKTTGLTSEKLVNTVFFACKGLPKKLVRDTTAMLEASVDWPVA